jgi:hypothetical protein
MYLRKLYICSECDGCESKSLCIKGKIKKPLQERSKRFESSKIFKEERALSVARIMGKEGKILRMNRSING